MEGMQVVPFGGVSGSRASRAVGRSFARTSAVIGGLLAAAAVAVGLVMVISGIIVSRLDDAARCPLFTTASRCPSMAPREVGGALLVAAGVLAALGTALIRRRP